MQIVTLLQHHLITHDCLRMEPLLPELMCALGLVFGAKVFELVEKPITAFALELFDYLPRGMPLEVTYNARHIGRRHNGVDSDSQIFMRATVLQRRDEDVAARRSCENGQPLDNG